jgi:branched-chain amino acid transport system ATP-binding protein
MGHLDVMGLAGRAHELASTLPLADQRRLELARALAADPRLLLLDEPAGGMTPRETAAMAEAIAGHAMPGRTVILIEHKIDMVTGCVRGLCVLNFGRRIAAGATAEVLRAPRCSRPIWGLIRSRSLRAMLAVENLHLAYGKVRAVQGVSLYLARGELVTLIGANGAGKSSVLHAVCGLAPAASGTIRFDGEDITGTPYHRLVRRGVVLVPEGRQLVAGLSVAET